MRYYISGPMTGRKDWNYPLFNTVASEYRGMGHTVLNPAESFGGQTGLPKEKYMRKDIGDLLKVDGIVMLPDWSVSEGAVLEHNIACALKLEIIYYGVDKK